MVCINNALHRAYSKKVELGETGVQHARCSVWPDGKLNSSWDQLGQINLCSGQLAGIANESGLFFSTFAEHSFWHDFIQGKAQADAMGRPWRSNASDWIKNSS